MFLAENQISYVYSFFSFFKHIHYIKNPPYKSIPYTRAHTHKHVLKIVKIR